MQNNAGTIQALLAWNGMKTDTAMAQGVGTAIGSLFDWPSEALGLAQRLANNEK